MQRLFKRSTDEVVEGSHQMVDFALDSDPSDPPPATLLVVWRGLLGLHQAIHAGRPKGPAYWCSPAQWTTLKGWGEGSSCMCKASVFDSALWTGAVVVGSRVSASPPLPPSRFAATPAQRAAPHKSSAR